MTEPEGEKVFLTMKQYAEKYGVEVGTLKGWVQRQWVVSEKREHNHHTRGLILAWHVLDAPPEDHPGFLDKYPKLRSVPFKSHSMGARKSLLKKMLPVFLEGSVAAKERYNRSELAVILGIAPRQLMTWESWGLPKTPFRGNKKLWKGDWYYARQDIIDFMSGDWDRLRAKIGGMEGEAAEQGETAMQRPLAGLEGYYVYQEDKVFPMGFEGFKSWLTEMKVMREDKRLRKWVVVEFDKMLPPEKEFFFNVFALKEDGDLKHQYGCTSRPRGETKSFDVKLAFLYRFFNFYRECILIAANSKEQSTFIQFDEAVKTINHTERLRNTPGLVIMQEQILLKEGPKDEFALIKPIAGKTGLLPNVTCVVFTEICELDDEKFYSQLTGSIRAVPNAQVLIDSTVAPKGHVLHRLYEAYMKNRDPLIYFQHYADKFYNPETTPEFLAHQKTILLPSEYDKYFRNRWEDATTGVFPEPAILEMGYAGVKGHGFGPSAALREAVEDIADLETRSKDPMMNNGDIRRFYDEIARIKSTLEPIETYYRFPASPDDIGRIASMLGCHVILGVGIDRANIFSKNNDRTVMELMARLVITQEVSLYLTVDLFISKEMATLDALISTLANWQESFGWLDKVKIETFQGQDLQVWCMDNGIAAELAHVMYNQQHEMFTQLCMAAQTGYLKCPAVPYYTDGEGELHKGFTSQKPDLVREEMANFMHDPHKKEFGSPTKKKKGGVKDDTVYGKALAMSATQIENPAGGGGFMAGKSGYPSPVVNGDVLGMY